jgi:hypothetical protein
VRGAAAQLGQPFSAGISTAANPHHEVCGVPGQFDDLILRHAGHGRTRDRSSEPVAGFDEVVLGPLVVLEGKGQSVCCHAPQHAVRPHSSPLDATVAAASRVRPGPSPRLAAGLVAAELVEGDLDEVGDRLARI